MKKQWKTMSNGGKQRKNNEKTVKYNEKQKQTMKKQ